MNVLKIFGIVLIAAMILTFGAEFGEQLSIPGAGALVLTAEARIGRPLTPVSVAGVARRTTRRCAVGVYNCQLPRPQSFESLLALVDSDSILIKELRPFHLLAQKMEGGPEGLM